MIGTARVMPPAPSRGQGYPLQHPPAGLRTSLPTTVGSSSPRVHSPKVGGSAMPQFVGSPVLRRDSQNALSECLGASQFGGSNVLRAESHSSHSSHLSPRPLTPNALSARSSHRGAASVPAPLPSTSGPVTGTIYAMPPTPPMPLVHSPAAKAPAILGSPSMPVLAAGGNYSTSQLPSAAGSLAAPVLSTSAAGSLAAPVLSTSAAGSLAAPVLSASAAGSLAAPVLSTASGLAAPVLSTSVTPRTPPNPLRAMQSSTSLSARSAPALESRGEPQRQRSSSRGNMEVWASAPSPLRQGISPRSVNVVEKMWSAADADTEERGQLSDRTSSVPGTDELPLSGRDRLQQRMVSTPNVPLAEAPSSSRGERSPRSPRNWSKESPRHWSKDSAGSGRTVQGENMTEEASSMVGVTIEVNALDESSPEKVNSSAAGTPAAAQEESPQLLLKSPSEEEYIMQDQETCAEMATENENEKIRTAKQEASYEKHLDRQKRARERKFLDKHGRVTATMAAWGELMNDPTLSRSRRGARGDGSWSPRSSTRSLPQARSSTPLGARPPKQAPSPRSSSGGSSSGRVVNGHMASGQRLKPGKDDRWLRFHQTSPVLSPRSEGRSTKNARLPGNILARLKQAQDYA